MKQTNKLKQRGGKERKEKPQHETLSSKLGEAHRPLGTRTLLGFQSPLGGMSKAL